mgnify:CR=1 FL=1
MLRLLVYNIIFLSGVIWSQIINPVSINARIDRVARAGEVVEINIDANMENQWWIYSVHKVVDGPLPTKITVDGSAIKNIGLVNEPEPLEKFDPGFEITSFYHSGNTNFSIPIKLKNNLKPGNYDLVLSVFFQVCNERLCYPPTTKSDTLSLVIETGDPSPDRLILNTSADNDNNINSILGIIILAIGGAIFSWVMPCVYPMIPIIISFFGKLSEEKHIGKSSVAFFYGLGIAGTFIIIGLAISLLSWGVNDAATLTGYANIGNFIATNAWVNLFLGVLFIFFALWMFGIVNVNVTGALLNKTDSAGQSANNAYIGSLILGIAFAITSFSCTVPVVGMLLVIAASGTAAGLLTSLLGMTIYGLVFAFPFVVLSLFPSSLEKLPRSGIWMEKVKVVFGFIELAAAVKFLWVPDLEWGLGLMPRSVVMILFIAIGIGVILYLAGIFSPLSNTAKVNQKQSRGVIGIIITFIILIPIILSLSSPPTFHYSGMPRIVDEIIETMVPPPPTDDEIAKMEGWFIDDYDGALEKARLEGKPLFIDFTGVYCANCRVMERRIFTLDSVKKQFDKMVLARLYVDKKDSLSAVFAQMQFEKFKMATQPYYAILEPNSEASVIDTGGYIPKGFDTFLAKGVKAFNDFNRIK